MSTYYQWISVNDEAIMQFENLTNWRSKHYLEDFINFGGK